MKRSLQQVADAIAARLVGDRNIEVSGVASIVSAGKEDLVFVEDAKRLVRQPGSLAAFVLQFTCTKIEAKACEMGGNRGYGGNLHEWALVSPLFESHLFYVGWPYPVPTAVLLRLFFLKNVPLGSHRS